MKKLLITAATEMELGPLLNYLKAQFQCPLPFVFQSAEWELHILITGVGMMQTSFALTQALAAQQFDAAIQLGIAGAFDTNIPLGAVVAVASERYGDLGAEDHDAYLDIFELGFLTPNTSPFEGVCLPNTHPFVFGRTLPLVQSLSVNTVSGNGATIERRKRMFGADIESMEGIAFHYACLQMQLPFLQIRALSNYVTPRNRSSWQIQLAIEQLNQFCIEAVQAL